MPGRSPMMCRIPWKLWGLDFAEGTWPAHILQHVTLELQNLAGMRGGFGRARSTFRRGVYKVAVRAWHEDITHTAMHSARDLVLAAMDPQAHGPFDVAEAVARLNRLADRLFLDPVTQCIADAATAKRQAWRWRAGKHQGATTAGRRRAAQHSRSLRFRPGISSM